MSDHPLQLVREQQAVKKHNRDLGGLIRQAIIDRLKTTGECHCDDLVSLYPIGEVAECRRLATAQFGSLAKCKLIHHPDNEWRASTSGTRKGGGGWVWKFTKAGWDKYGRAGVSAGRPSSQDGGGLGKADKEAGTHSGDAGDSLPRSGAGAQGELTGAPARAGTASPDNLPGGRGEADPARSQPADAAPGEILSLFPEPEQGTSPYDPWKDAA